jgi:hypothetical protein
VGVGVGGAALATTVGDDGSRTATSFAGSSTPTASTSAAPSPTAETPPPPPGIDTTSAYAVLDAPGWTAPLENVIADEKLYYVRGGSGDASASLNWRPSPALGSKYTVEQEQAELDSRYGGEVVVGTTTIDGDPANIYRDGSHFNVVGPIEQGRFLTLSSTGLTLEQITELATHVHRQVPEHDAFQPVN